MYFSIVAKDKYFHNRYVFFIFYIKFILLICLLCSTIMVLLTWTNFDIFSVTEVVLTVFYHNVKKLILCDRG